MKYFWFTQIYFRNFVHVCIEQGPDVLGAWHDNFSCFIASLCKVCPLSPSQIESNTSALLFFPRLKSSLRQVGRRCDYKVICVISNKFSWLILSAFPVKQLDRMMAWYRLLSSFFWTSLHRAKIICLWEETLKFVMGKPELSNCICKISFCKMIRLTFAVRIK